VPDDERRDERRAGDPKAMLDVDGRKENSPSADSGYQRRKVTSEVLYPVRYSRHFLKKGAKFWKRNSRRLHLESP
jgi:hypothetical protein